jgi:hypothetical protein
MSTTPLTPRALVERGASLAALGWPIVDAHAHLGPTWQFAIPTPDAVAMVAMMERLGIGKTILSPHLAIGYDVVRGNDLAAAVAREFAGRLYGYVTANPRYPELMEEELRRGLDELGLVGIKLHPTLHNFSVLDPTCTPVWQCAQERGLPILIHTWEGDPRCRPSHFAELAAQYPAARFILGHSGGQAAGRREAVAVALAHPNVYLELCCSYLTCADLEGMVATMGAQRILFGTDSPWIDPRFLLGKVAFANLAVEEQRMLLGENALALFGLPR